MRPNFANLFGPAGTRVRLNEPENRKETVIVSVIIPTFNRGYILAEAITSVLKQTYSNFEVIIVDDGSTDNTVDIARNFRDHRVRLIRHEKNRGVAAARNSGLEAAQGEFISFLDSDDLWQPEKLALETTLLDAHPEMDAVFTDVSKIDGEHSVPSMARTCPIFRQFLTNTNSTCGVAVPRRTMYLCMLQEMPVKIQATTFRQKLLGGNWRFQETWQSGEDWELLLRFARTHVFGFVDRPLVIQRVMSDSTLGRHEKADALMLRDQFIREKRSLQGDREAIAAVRRGIATHSNRLGHCYLEDGKLLDSAKAFLKGFLESGDFGLLVYVPSVYFPPRFRSMLKRLLRNGVA